MPNINNFSSKADALKFAIEFTSSSDMSGSRTFERRKRKSYSSSSVKNVELPDTPLTQWKDVINQADDIAKMIKEYLVQTINAQKANENTASN